jgi:restriction system protein
VGSIILLALVLTVIAGYYISKYRNQINLLNSIATDIQKTNEEVNRTLAIGLYHRFKKEDGKEENPFDFERFVAKIMGQCFGGNTHVTPSSHDFGIDIEHQRKDGLYLGQVKCYAGPVGYEPIAIVHSQMVKQNAEGGFVVTTGMFTEHAHRYAQNHNIELIDGIMLVRYWLKGKKESLEFFKRNLEPHSKVTEPL